jgi:hypothetical protein
MFGNATVDKRVFQSPQPFSQDPAGTSDIHTDETLATLPVHGAFIDPQLLVLQKEGRELRHR